MIVKSLALVADGDVGAMGERHPRAPLDVNRRDLEETTENLVIMPVVFRLEIRAARKHEVRTGPGALVALVSHGSTAKDTRRPRILGPGAPVPNPHTTPTAILMFGEMCLRKAASRRTPPSPQSEQVGSDPDVGTGAFVFAEEGFDVAYTTTDARPADAGPPTRTLRADRNANRGRGQGRNGTDTGTRPS